MVSTLGSAPVAGSGDRCPAAASTPRGEGPWGSPGVGSRLWDTGEGCGAGTCCPCSPQFPQTGLCSHRGTPCAQQCHSSSTGTTMSGLTSPCQVSQLHTPPLPCGSPASSAGGPSVPVLSPPSTGSPVSEHPLQAQLRDLQWGVASGVTAVLGDQPRGPAWPGGSCWRDSPPQLLGLGGPGLIPASLISQPSRTRWPVPR